MQRVSQRLSRRVTARRPPIVAMVPYTSPPMLTLGQDDATLAAANAARSQLFKAIAVAVILLVIAWVIEEFMKRQSKPITRNRVVKKMSTADLAKNLYERLEKRPGTNPSVLRSLSTYAEQ
jgi:hypothetical protein